MCSVFKWEIVYVLGVHITALSRRGPCLFFLHGVFFCRCCVTETIPASYLEQVRHKYLNYDTRAQRKDFLLQCTDPRSRYTPNAFVVFAMVAFSWFPCICAYVLVSVSLCSVCVCHKHYGNSTETGMPSCNVHLLCLFHPLTGAGMLLPAVSSQFAGKD